MGEVLLSVRNINPPTHSCSHSRALKGHVLQCGGGGRRGVGFSIKFMQKGRDVTAHNYML